jgi:hypothetical protein
MKLLRLFIPIFLIVVLGCDDPKDKVSYEELNVEENEWFLPHLPAAKYKIAHIIPEQYLFEHDVEFLNTEYLEFYDENKVLIGFGRKVATEVGCEGGQCKPIRFYIMFDDQGEYISVFHPEGRIGDGEFYKGIECVPGIQSTCPVDYICDATGLSCTNDASQMIDDELFTNDDLLFLHNTLLNPPTLLVDATETSVIVDATTTATYSVFENIVVKEAAYSTYTVLMYMLTTQELIKSLI